MVKCSTRSFIHTAVRYGRPNFTLLQFLHICFVRKFFLTHQYICKAITDQQINVGELTLTVLVTTIDALQHFETG